MKVNGLRMLLVFPPKDIGTSTAKRYTRGSVTTKSEIFIENIRSLGFQDIRKGVTFMRFILQRLGCILQIYITLNLRVTCIWIELPTTWLKHEFNPLNAFSMFVFIACSFLVTSSILIYVEYDNTLWCDSWWVVIACCLGMLHFSTSAHSDL